MDYKYIEQLLERYWECETSIEEEKILRSFFSQENIPGSLLSYKALFTSMQEDKHTNVLGDDFDQRMLEMVEEPTRAKARTVKLTQRLMPLFKAAAVVAIILSLGNALQMALDTQGNTPTNMAGMEQHTDGPSVAKNDTIKVDTTQKSVQLPPTAIIK